VDKIKPLISKFIEGNLIVQLNTVPKTSNISPNSPSGNNINIAPPLIQKHNHFKLKKSKQQELLKPIKILSLKSPKKNFSKTFSLPEKKKSTTEISPSNKINKKEPISNINISNNENNENIKDETIDKKNEKNNEISPNVGEKRKLEDNSDEKKKKIKNNLSIGIPVVQNQNQTPKKTNRVMKQIDDDEAIEKIKQQEEALKKRKYIRCIFIFFLNFFKVFFLKI
jgi:hypothetical protein